MLLLGSRLLNAPVMGLQTGTKLATTKCPVIDPANLKIVAYEVEGAMLSERPSFLRVADVRELSNVGMIIDGSDEFFGKDDIINIRKILDLSFHLIGLNVIDESKRKLGKVFDYSVDSDSFFIQQINIKPSVIKSFSQSELLVHRSQIVEINDYSIIVKSASKKIEPLAKPEKLSYINPFRATSTEHSTAREL